MSDEQTPKPPPPPWERGRDESSETPGEQQPPPPPLQTGSGGTGGTQPPPRRPGGPGEPPPPYQPPATSGFPSGGDPTDAARRVKAPAITMMVVAIIGLGFQVLNLVITLFDPGARQAIPPDAMEMIEEAYGPELAESFVQAIEIMQNPIAMIGTYGLYFLISGIIIYGSLQMMKLEKRAIAITAAVLGMVPCISPCCCILLPVGIWALIVLLDEDVKDAFYS